MGRSKATKCIKKSYKRKHKRQEEPGGADEPHEEASPPPLLSPELMEGINDSSGNPVLMVKEPGSTGRKRKLDARGKAVDDEVSGQGVGPHFWSPY